MNLNQLIQLVGAGLILALAFLYFKAREKLADRDVNEKQREQRNKIEKNKEAANEAKTNYADALDRFRSLLKRYRSKK